jgi:hypothetical protein
MGVYSGWLGSSPNITPTPIGASENMRKLLREITIFALLGFIVASVSLFVNLEKGIKISAARDAAKAVHADTKDHSPMQGLPSGSSVAPNGTPDFLPSPPGFIPDVLTVAVPLTNGTVLHVRVCGQSSGPWNKYIDCREFSAPDPYKEFGGHIISIPLGHPDQIALEKDYWAAHNKTSRQNLFSNATGSLLLGLLWGFPCGIGVWIFYRLVRFAITG